MTTIVLLVIVWYIARRPSLRRGLIRRLYDRPFDK